MSTLAQSEETARGGFKFNRDRIYGIIFMATALLIVLLFAREVLPGNETTFVLTDERASAIPIPDIVFPTQLALYVFAIVSAFIGGIQFARGFKRANLMLLVVSLIFVLAFLSWASGLAERSLNLTVLLRSTLLRATPIALAGLSGVLCERAAVINIAIEGMMLIGAFASALFGSLAANVWGVSPGLALFIGLVAGILAGGLLGLLHAMLSVTFKVDQIVGATAINIFATGLTSFLSARLLAEFQFLNNSGTFSRIPIPLLSKIPIIGPVVFEQNILVYLMFILLAATHIMLFYTRWGLRTRAVGEHPKAADTLGIDVYLTRYVNVVMGGMVAGLAGSFLVLGSVGRFDELMTAGKGFIGLAAMIFGKWMPFGTLGAALIFGFSDSLQTRLAILSVPIPSQFLLMAPYLVTMIVLAGVVGEANAPAADGQPYDKH